MHASPGNRRAYYRELTTSIRKEVLNNEGLFPAVKPCNVFLSEI